jgi:hypothetical protein
MPDSEVTVDFVERVRAGLVDGWRTNKSSQGESIVDLKGHQAWTLHPDEPPFVAGSKRAPRRQRPASPSA